MPFTNALQRNLFASNKEYEGELKKEKESHEKKLGILKYLVDVDDSLANGKPWWSEIPKRAKEAKPLGTLLAYASNSCLIISQVR